MTEQFTAPAEALQTGEQILAGLREERWHNAENMSSHAMSRAIRQMDRLSAPDVTPLDKNVDFVPYMTSLSPAEAIALEAIGIDPAILVPKIEPLKKVSSRLVLSGDHSSGYERKGSFAVGEAKLIVEQEAYETNTFSYRIISENEADKASLRDTLHARIGAAFSERPAYQRVHEAIAQAGDDPNAITIKLNIDEDSQGVLSVLADVGLFRWNNAQVQERILQGKITPKEAISQALEDRVQKGGLDSADFIKVSYNDGVKHTVFLDKHSGEISLTLEQQPADYYVEKANQWHEVSDAFIDTPCAKELFDLLAAQGLTVSRDVHHEMARAGEAVRFGSIYTQLSREVAKWIDKPARTKVSNILAVQEVPFDNEDANVESDQESKLRDLLSRIQTDGVSEPTRVLLTMMQEAVSRTSYMSDLEVTKQQVHISKSACFDVMTYYVGAPFRGGVHAFEENGVAMLRKTYGGNTFMTIGPITFNGVKLPKGALFSKADDDKWFFQRLTPFTFDSPSDMAVFGSEVAKTKDVAKDSIADLGGMSLGRIVESVL